MSTRSTSILAALALAALAACSQGAPDGSSTATAGSAAAISSNGVNATMTVDAWGGGYCANITLANTSTAPVTSWTLVAALNGTALNNLWGGTSTTSGGQLTIKPVDYNANIAPGASQTLGFCGTGSGQPALSTLTVVGGSTNPTTFALTIGKAGQGAGTVASTPSGLSCGSTCTASFTSGTVVTLTATAASGSTFAGWGGACSGTAAACTVTMTAAQTVTASFSGPIGDTYALAVTRSGTGSGAVASSPAGISCGSTCTATYASGTAVTLTASAATGSTFAGWSGACTGTGTCIVTMTAAQSVGAAFDAVSTGISISAGGSASGTFLADTDYTGGSTYSTTAAIDTSLVPSPVPPQSVLQHERYGAFTYTIPGLAAGSPYAVTLYFAESYWTAAGQRNFNVSINGAGVLSAFDIYAAAGGQNKAVARSFNATANNSGQVVIAFSAGTVDNPKVDGITVAPGTAPVYYAVSVSKTGNGTVSGNGISCGTSCTGQYAAGTTVTLTAAPTSPATFSGWGGACTGSATTCVLSMTADRTVSATFQGGTTTQGPCDIYQAASTPCVAAHSTVRALYAAYTGSLYQVRRASDGGTKDIPVLAAGGFANTSVQDQFCANTSCTISIIYDQSPQKNDLKKAPPGATWLPNGGNESSATKGKTTVGGHTVYGIYVTAFSDNVAYRITNTNGVAKGNQAESMYMVVDGRRYSKDCCFDYGNAETNGKDNGNGTMEALYFGTDTSWGGKGDGNGPWIAADLENGMFKGNAGCYNCNPGPWPSAKSLTYNYVSAFLKGPAANTFTLKGGNAQSGSLITMWNSVRPTPNYYPKKLEGAIILGTGGDGSNGGTGTFFEGAMTIGNPPDSVDDAIQANIVAAGYGR